MPETAEMVNPLREGIRLRRTPDPCAMVIFGASGDLTERKLIPALFYLSRERMLPPGFSVVGCARTPKTDEQFSQEMSEAVKKFLHLTPESDAFVEGFAKGLHYVADDFSTPEAYQKLKDTLDHLDQEHGTAGNRLFYLATPPSFFPVIVKHLGAAGLAKPKEPGKTWTRIILEKPFGRSLESARELNQTVTSIFDEDQVYRIDHYLGKETVQNLLVFRFANGIFEPFWNRRYIDHVQISVAEELGVENRGAYYEESGLLRDMIQNHVLQLLSLVAMEPPATFQATAVRDEKAKVMRALRPIRAGAGAGICGAGPVRGRIRGGQEGSRLPDGAQGFAHLEHGDLRGFQVLHRQLALGGRPLLPALRQASAQARFRNLHSVSPRAAPAFQRRGRGRN